MKPVLIPVDPQTKRPTVKGWANPDFETPDFPAGASYGLRADGVVVVDADTAEAAETWGNLTGDHATVKSPRGYHFYYRLPEAEHFGPSTNAELHLDVRSGSGSYAIIPPSAGYTWVGPAWDGDPAKLPLAPVEAVRSIQPRRQEPTSPTEGWDNVPEGQRNTFLTALAGALRRQGAGAEAIAATVATFNANRCDPPLPSEELLAIVRSTLRYEPDPDEGGGDIDILIDGDDPEEGPRPPIIWAGDLEVPAPPRWLQHPFLPAGRLVLVDGNEGIGKGMFATWIATSLAASRLNSPPAPTLWGSTEDDPAEDILRRLLAAGYEPAKHAGIGFLNGDAMAWRYPADIGKLAEQVRVTGAKVLILDPGRSFLGPPTGMNAGEFSYNNEAHIRPGLEALNLLARKLDVTVVFIHHWNKNLTASIRVRSGGSAAFAQTVRHRVTLNYMAGSHAIAVEKSNMLAREHTVHRYELEPVEALDTARFVLGELEHVVDLDEWERVQRGDGSLTAGEEAGLNAGMVVDAANRELSPGDRLWNRDELVARFGLSQRVAKAVIQELREAGHALPGGAHGSLVWSPEGALA